MVPQRQRQQEARTIVTVAEQDEEVGFDLALLAALQFAQANAQGLVVATGLCRHGGRRGYPFGKSSPIAR